MGIYDDNRFSFPTVKISFKQFKYSAIAIVALIFAIALLFALNDVLRPSQLELSLQPNPLDLTSFLQSSATLDIKVFNVKNETVSPLVVTVSEVGGNNLLIFPASREVDSMGPQTVQELKPFIIRVNPGKTINSGSYKLKVVLEVAGEKTAEEELTLSVKAV